MSDERNASDLTDDDIDQIVEGIECFIINGDTDVDQAWQPYVDKLQAFKSQAKRTDSRA